MSATEPIDWVGIEDTLHDWIMRATGLAGDKVRMQVPRDAGPARGAPDTCTIELLSMVPISRQERVTMPQTMQQRLTVLAVGPGTVGIDFYPSRSETAQPISIVAGIGATTAASAAALLAQLTIDLPAGYSAIVDPANSSALLLSGSAAQPLFASAPVDDDFLAVATTIPRFPELVRVQHSCVWRLTFRGSGVSGTGLAANLMAKAQLYRQTLADPAMRRLGFDKPGTRNATPSVPSDRSESTAVLDVSWIGYMTGAEAASAMRVIGTNLAIAS